MSPEPWQRLNPQKATPAERIGFVDDGCNRKPALDRPAVSSSAERRQTQSIDNPIIDPPRRLEHQSTLRFQPDQLILNRFRIVRHIDSGGMGEVYEAVDLQLGIVALKTIRSTAANSKDAFERFRQEVLLARKVSGGQVCRIHELFLLPAGHDEAWAAVLTMEFLDGVTLKRKLKEHGPMTWKQALPIALELCEGLRLIHKEGVIHRDLKPGNIMLCQQKGSVRTVLMDFGLAQDFSAPTDNAVTAPAKTATGVIVGTPPYMAPEQFGGHVSPRTDIYALGIILYELVTGVYPFSTSTPLAAPTRRGRHHKPPSSVQPAVPRQWDRIIGRCLEFEPESRYQSAAQVASALRASPANLKSLQYDRPWILWCAYALIAVLLAWPAFLWWQDRQLYHPNADALRWYDAGVAALREGDYVKATRSLQQSTTLDPHYVMAHARLAEAWSNLDFDGNAKDELLIATRGEQNLPPLDRMYFNAIRAVVTKDTANEVTIYQQILDRLPPGQKSAGYVDLGMAYERTHDPTHALKNYTKATSLDANNVASHMHTAILQSRQHDLPKAEQAFQKAQALLSFEMNQEGLADFDYERGFALNDGSNKVAALAYLDRALDEAKAIPSVQLQIRVLTSLSTAAYISKRYEESVKDAREAIDLAQSNHLDGWAANGYVRLANAELQEGNLTQAETAVRKALDLAGQGKQPRYEAGANATLASIMNLRNLPDQVIAPAQAALAYYTQNGFLDATISTSQLLIRSQRDKGEYAAALQSARAFQDLATKSGVRLFTYLSQELLGTIYLQMEQYPNALEPFRNALSRADGPDEEAIQNLHSAETLWRLGRYNESDEMFRSVQGMKKFEARLDEVQLPMLLSRMKYKDADALAQKMLDRDPAIDPIAKQDLELSEVLAESHLHLTPAVHKRFETISSLPDKTTVDGWHRQLLVAETALSVGMPQQALDTATRTAEHYAATNQLESGLRSVCIAAAAAKTLNKTDIFQQFSKKALDILAQLQQSWESQAPTTNLSRPDSKESPAFATYLSRPDLQALLRGAAIQAPFTRR